MIHTPDVAKFHTLFEGFIKAKDLKKKELRLPPQSIESEQAVLGSIMLRKDAMHEVEDVVSPDSFYAEKHKKGN